MPLPLLVVACVHQRCVGVVEGDEVVAQRRRVQSRELFEDDDLLGQGVAAPAPLLHPVRRRIAAGRAACATSHAERCGTHRRRSTPNLDSHPTGMCSSAHARTVGTEVG